jgi:FAD/FMN-containing dehydrogenase
VSGPQDEPADRPGGHERPLSGWGRYPRAMCSVIEPAGTASLPPLNGGVIARGNGRSYGDASLGQGLTLASAKLDRMLAFDPATGTLTCEGGVRLSDIIAAMLPRGWFPTVTPGTKFVTVGGMVASDVHGKNHHGAGSFCDHLDWIDLAIGDGQVRRCSHAENPDLFAATCGGMGLTGVVLRACFRLLPVETSRIRQSVHRTRDLAETMALFEANNHRTYSVAWIDCLASGAALGRSVVSLGEHALVGDLAPADRAAPLSWRPLKPKTVPIDLPGFALGRLSVKAFNAVYYRAQRAGPGVVDFNPYFYPLDALLEWNRIYGRRGFVQYQCVLPLETSEPGLRRLLTEIAGRGSASFLAVLKRMGHQSFGMMSFPRPGYTLALDFPATTGSFALLDELDAITLDHGGRVYLAKDARTSARGIAAGYPRLDEFRAVRARHGLSGRFRSLQSERLEI